MLTLVEINRAQQDMFSSQSKQQQAPVSGSALSQEAKSSMKVRSACSLNMHLAGHSLLKKTLKDRV